MGGCIRHALFIYEFIYMKGDNMEKLKKFRKIFMVLFGVMVLMLGSVSVFASDSLTASSAYKSACDYFAKNGAVADGVSISASDFSKYKYHIVLYDKSREPYGYRVLFLTDKATCDNFNGFQDIFELHSDSYIIDYRVTLSDGSLDPKASFIRKKINFNCGDSFSNTLSNYTVKKTDGTVVLKSDTTGFFPAPPIAERAGVLPAVVTEKVEAILPVAVCCLALLTFSTILLKRLPRFLG